MTYLGFVFMKKWYLIITLFGVLLAFASCSAPQYLTLPSKASFPVIKNTGSFGIQNMDEQAKVEIVKDLVSHYDGFDVKYTISSDFSISFIIVNNSNKDLLIDKSQCYVLFDGNASQLFKDVRLTGSTTFNDVQGAINNVQTSHGSVMMTIPSYSKYTLPLTETNITNILLPEFQSKAGVYPLSPYDNPGTVEFIIPYSFDPTMKKWKTSRNRIYVNSIVVENDSILVSRSEAYGLADGHYQYEQYPTMISSTEYISIKGNGKPNLSEVQRIDAINQELFKKHNRQVRWGRVIGGVLTLPTIAGPIYFWAFAIAGCLDEDHYPPK